MTLSFTKGTRVAHDLLYHECHVESESVEALRVTRDSLRLDDGDDVNVKDIKAGVALHVKDIKAGVAELKVTDDDVNSKAEYERFFNMCGEAAKLAASVFCKGSLAKNQ